MPQQNPLFPIKQFTPNQPALHPKKNIPQQQVEQPIHFNIPKAPLQMPPATSTQPVQQEPNSEPKKKSWKIWFIIISLIIIIGGLGVYFLKG